MKNHINKISIILTLILMFLPSAMKAETLSREDLKKFIAGINASCPINLGQTHSITSYALEADTVIISYEYTIPVNEVDTDNYSLDILLRRYNVFAELYPNETYVAFFFIKLLQENGLYLKYELKNRGVTKSILISPEKINTIISQSPDYKKLLLIEVEEEKNYLPINIMGELEFLDIELNENQLKYIIEINEEYLNINDMNKDKNVRKELIASQIIKSNLYFNGDIRLISYLCAKCNCAMCFEYQGNVTGQNFTIEFTPEEIFSIMNITNK